MNGDNTETPRVYQHETKYNLPKDTSEHERLEGQAESLAALMNGRPFHPPLSEPKKILDIGCGTGHGTHLLALQYPTAHIVGIDLAAVPEVRAKLENIEYVQADILDVIGVDPRFELESYDYIFSRFLILGVTRWPEYIASVSTLLKPSGWLELQEPALTLRSSRREVVEGLESYYSNLAADATAIGLDLDVGNHLLYLLSSTPVLKNIREAQYSFNPNLTDETPELFGLKKQLPGIFALGTTRICSRAGRKQEEIEIMTGKISSALERGLEEGVYLSVYAVIGQKKANLN